MPDGVTTTPVELSVAVEEVQGCPSQSVVLDELQVSVTLSPAVIVMSSGLRSTLGPGMVLSKNLQFDELLTLIGSGMTNSSRGEPTSGTIKRLQMVLAERIASSGMESLPALTSLAPPVATRAWMRLTASLDFPVTSITLWASLNWIAPPPTLVPLMPTSAAR